MRFVIYCEAEDQDHQCTEEAPMLEALSSGLSGNLDADWYPVCQKHTKNQRSLRLNFDTREELWSRVSAALEGEAEFLSELGFQADDIRKMIDQAVTNAMVHSEFYDVH